MKQTSKQFKELQSTWYKKLEKSGFKDLEKRRVQDNMHGLNNSALTNITTFYDQTSFEIKQEYYRKAGHFLYDYDFDSIVDRKIWECHAEGISIRAIVRILDKKGFKVYKRLVHETIQRLCKEMLAKHRL